MRPFDSRHLIDDFEPVYLAPANRSRLRALAGNVDRLLADCHACPRHCGANRTAGQTGICQTGRHARVASAAPHHGEEAVLRGWGGSGTIFFSRCNLQCVFCQNYDISQEDSGRPMTADQIADLCLHLQAAGCHNINFVTPEHVGPQVIEALDAAVDKGLRLPVVYNTSAYDSIDTLRQLNGIVDIYMPDFKLWTHNRAARLLRARDYPDRARDAITEMHRQVGDLRVGADGLARRGLLVRHLVMPGLLDESAAIFRWLADEISKDTHLNIMGQYHPANRVGRRLPGGQVQYLSINRTITGEEMRTAYRHASDAGLWRFDKED